MIVELHGSEAIAFVRRKLDEANASGQQDEISKWRQVAQEVSRIVDQRRN
jgi:hypothetical protein